jgi:hypothetical protein
MEYTLAQPVAARQDVPGSQPASVVTGELVWGERKSGGMGWVPASSASPSRSAAETRPPATTKAAASGRRWLRAVNAGLRRAALPVGDKAWVRRALALLLRELRDRARANLLTAVDLGNQVARVVRERDDAKREVSLWKAATGASVPEHAQQALWNLRDDLRQAERERDDALMQASAAAERAHRAEQDREALAAQVAEVESALGEESRDAGELTVAVARLVRENEELRQLGRVVRPEGEP